MKKFFSLLIAVLMVMSASYADNRQIHGKRVRHSSQVEAQPAQKNVSAARKQKTGDGPYYKTIVFDSPSTMTYYKADHDWYFDVYNNDYEALVDVISDNPNSPIGIYSYDKGEWLNSYCEISLSATSETFEATGGVVTIEQLRDTIFVEAIYETTNDTIYTLKLFYPVPKPISQKIINGVCGRLDGYVFTVIDGENSFVFNYYTPMVGTHERGDSFFGTLRNTTTGDQYDMYSGTVTITEEADYYVIDGKVLFTNNTEYTLRLTRLKDVPTVVNLTDEGYNLSTNAVLCFYFGEKPCKDVYFVGDQNNWGKGSGTTEDYANCSKFDALSGHDGWYVVSVPVVAGQMGGKPIQESADGVWSWDYQAGDSAAWHQYGNVYNSSIKTATITKGEQPDEANVAFPSAGAYIYYIDYWKAHNTPCTPEDKYSVTIRLQTPSFTPEAIEIAGSFDSWAGTPLTLQDGVWTATIQATASDVFKIREIGNTANSMRHYTTLWETLPSAKLSDFWKDGASADKKVIELDWSNPEEYRWVKPNYYTPECFYQLHMHDRYGDGWNGCALKVVDGDSIMIYTLKNNYRDSIAQVPYFGHEVEVYFVHGSYPDEISFTFLAPNGVGMFHLAEGEAEEIPDGQLVTTIITSPCSMTGANPYMPQNIQANLTEERKLAISWDAVNGAAWYSWKVLDSNGNLLSERKETEETSDLSAIVSDTGDYTIIVTSYDASGMPLGTSEKIVHIELPMLSSATINVLVPSDCNMDVTDGLWLRWYTEPGDARVVKMTPNGAAFTATIKPNAPTYNFSVMNKSDMGAADVQMSVTLPKQYAPNYCCQVMYNFGDPYFNLSPYDCNLNNHDYRVGNFEQVATPGRLLISWKPYQNVSREYYIQLIDASTKYNITSCYVEDTTRYEFFVEDWLDGREVLWTIRPQSPYQLPADTAFDAVVLQKAKAQFESINISTADHISLDLTWKYNTDTLNYLVEVYARDNMMGSRTCVKREIVNKTNYHYTAICPASYYCYVTPLNSKNELAGQKVSSATVELNLAPAPVSNLTASVSGRNITFTWEKIASIPAVYTVLVDEKYDLIKEDTIEGTSLVWTADKDGLYILEMLPLAEFEPGQLKEIPYPLLASATVFSGPTYSVTLSATEGGMLLPGTGTNKYPQGYKLELAAIPNTGYYFDKWSDGETSSNRVITVNGNITFQAIFVKIPEYNVSVKATQGGKIRITNSWSGNLIYDWGTDFAGLILEGNQINLYTQEEEGYSFIGWSDGNTDIDRYNMGISQDTALTAIFQKNHTLTISPSLNGSVDVQSYNWIKKEGDVYTYVYGTQVQVVAKPLSGYHFVKWSDNVETIQRVVTMTEDVTLSAIFEAGDLGTHAVVVDSRGDGYGGFNHAAGTTNYQDGAKIEITAMPDISSEFIGWVRAADEDQIITTANPWSVAISQDTALLARFNLKKFNLQVSASAGGSVNTEVNGIHPYGYYCTLYATPAEHYVFVDWSDGYENPVYDINLFDNLTLTANFRALQKYNVKATANTGGKIKVTGMTDWATQNTSLLDEGQSVTVVAKPDDNYRFAGWSDGIIAVQRTFILSQDTNFTANFERIPNYKLTVNASDGGAIKVSGMPDFGATYTANFDQSEVISLEARPNEGYIFVQWSDGEKAAVRSISLSEDTQLTAQFALIRTLTINVSGDGHVDFDGDYITRIGPVYTIADGTVIRLTAVPDAGKRFTGWGDGEKIYQRVITITSDLALNPTFEDAGSLAQYELKLAKSGSGGGTLNDVAGVYYEGDEVEIIATPNANSEFIQWEDGSKANPRKVTINGEMTVTATFNIKMITLSLSQSEGGSVDAKGININEKQIYGTGVTLTATAHSHYTFVSWMDGVTLAERYVVLTQDTTFSAMFEAKKYTITFENYDGTVLQSGKWKYGVLPEYSGETPVKPNDGSYKYTFSGWNPTIYAVDGDQTYTATFNSEAIQSIDNTDAEGVARKVMESDRIYIILPDGRKYNVLGEKIN